MANKLSELIVKITADTKAFQQSMGNLAKETKAIGSTLTDIGTRMTVGLTAPIVGFGAAALKASADMQALKLGLNSITKDSAKTEEQLKRLKVVAALPGLGFPEAVQGSINLQAAGYSAGLAERALKSFGNALATVGKGKAELDGVILALGQISSKGKISAEEINQLAERLPQIRVAMKAAFGTADTEALQKMGIDAQQFVERVTAEFEKLPQVTGGLKNSFENLQDRINQSLAKAGDAFAPFAEMALGTFDKVIAAIGRMAEAFAGLPTVVKAPMAALLAAFAVGGPLLIGMGAVISSVGQIAGAFKTLKVSAEGFLATSGRLAMVLKGIGFVGLATALYQLFDALNDKGKISTTTKALDNLNKALAQNSANAAGSGAAFDKVLGHIRKIDEGARGATVGAKELSDAFAALGIKSTSELTAELNKARAALKTVEQAFREGKASANDVSAAQQMVAKALESIEGPAAKTAKSFASIPFAEKSPEARMLALEVEDLARKSDASGKAALDLREKWAAFNAMEFATGFNVLASSMGDKIVTASLKASEGLKLIKTGLEDIVLAAAQVDIMDKLQKFEFGQEAQKGAKDVRRALDEMKPAITAAGKRFKELGREVSTIFNDLGRGIADAIVEWKGFGSLVENVAKDISKALIRWAIKEGIMKVADALGELGGVAAKVGKGLGDIFGGATSAAGTAARTASTVGSGASGAAGAAGSAASASGSGAASWIGAISGVATAVSSIIGNFQMSGMNKSLDLIVNHTLRTANQLIEGIQPQINAYLPKIQGLIEFHYGPHMAILNQINDSIRMGGGGGGQSTPIVINIDGRTVASVMARNLKLQGA